MPISFVTLPATGTKVGSSLITTFNGAADAGGAYSQMSKQGWGADGTYNDVTATTPLPTRIYNNSLVSTANSSEVNLAANAVLTGTSEEVSEFSTVSVAVFASHASATDGLSMQQSVNGTTWDFVDVYTIPAASGKTFSAPVQGKFFRLVNANGATATTSFRVQTIYSHAAKKGSAIRPQDNRSNDNDVEEIAALLSGFDGTAWQRLRSSILNGLVVDVTRIAELRATTLWVPATAATGVAATASLPAAGAGLFHYITSISISLYATAARVGSATPVTVTSTNLPGSAAWNFPTAQAIGAMDRVSPDLVTPIKSLVANTISTVAAPIATTGIWRLNVGYFTGA